MHEQSQIYRLKQETKMINQTFFIKYLNGNVALLKKEQQMFLLSCMSRVCLTYADNFIL